MNYWNFYLDNQDWDLLEKMPNGFKDVQEGVTYGDIIRTQYNSTVVGKKRDVIIALPPNYSEEKTYPVLFLFHGLGQDEKQWLEEGMAPMIAANLAATGEAKEMIIVMPNCRARMNDAANPADEFSLDNYEAFNRFREEYIQDLRPFLKENYKIAEGRENTAVAGFSMGGREALYFGFGMQDAIGYVAAFCPAPGIFAYDMNGVAEPGFFSEKEFRIQEGYRTPVMIVGGKSDTVVASYPELYHTILQENGSSHVWYQLEGGHGFQVCCKALYHFMRVIFE